MNERKLRHRLEKYKRYYEESIGLINELYEIIEEHTDIDLHEHDYFESSIFAQYSCVKDIAKEIEDSEKSLCMK